MKRLSMLQNEIAEFPQNVKYISPYLMAQGFSAHWDDPAPSARARAIESLFTKHEKYIYNNDLIAGSLRGRLSADDTITGKMLEHAAGIVQSYGANHFGTNADHFAPDYETFLQDGIRGTLNRIQQSLLIHKNDADFNKKRIFLEACGISVQAFSAMIRQYGRAAEEKHFTDMAEVCYKISEEKPETFREALQLVWLTHIAFVYEGRYAMALGRLDQYLYPFYRKSIDSGEMTREEALELIECTLCKIGEARYFGGDDVVNIAIGGCLPNGEGGVNELSYLILEAVGNCNIPGPNLSARIYEGIPDEFLDRCLTVIGTGLGYPALMNDEVNIPALRRHGYSIEDSRNYCMVGCIENFIQGRQPPWSDGRYNSPKFIELALNNGRCMQTGIQMGPETGEPGHFTSMEEFMSILKKQMEYGAAEYMARFRNENGRYNKIAYSQPFLSCFCRCCIERGMDINDGGALYPSVHGAGCMGIGTMADSLAAIEEMVYRRKKISLQELRDALMADFSGYEDLQAQLLKVPKYGNNDPLPDKYAVWFVDVHDEIFSKYRTPDGGAVYTAIASNVSNIPAGAEIAATPDGRNCGQPISDAASPMHGFDRNGPTAVLLSTSKPDYRKVSCGTVLNQKYSPSMFSDPVKRGKLRTMIQVYFKKGGQEIQINAVSRALLQKAIARPEEYRNLVVRVSGFSAYYTCLDPSIQKDILERTEHGE